MLNTKMSSNRPTPMGLTAKPHSEDKAALPATYPTQGVVSNLTVSHANTTERLLETPIPVIGWVVALAMAVNNPTPPVTQTILTPPPSEPDSTERAYPFCAENIKPKAIVCKHCGRDLPPEVGDSA